jgi:menaquinone-dependent protoporphyrinogen IX oxidase
MDFMKANRSELNRKPLATFLVCMTLAMPEGEKFQTFVRDFMIPIRAYATPISECCFPGGLNISKIPSFFDRLKFRLSVRMGVWSEGDHTDMYAVRQWAEQLSEQLANTSKL